MTVSRMSVHFTMFFLFFAAGRRDKIFLYETQVFSYQGFTMEKKLNTGGCNKLGKGPAFE